MASRIARAIAIGSVVVAGVVGIGSTAHATNPATPTTRYASPSGTATTTCATTAPCDIVTAIDDAPMGSDVIIEPGTYGSATTPLTTTLTDTNSDLYIHGEAGKPRPVIDSNADHSGFSIQSDSQLSQVIVHYTGSTAGIDVTGTARADHLLVESSGGPAIACAVDAVLSDSVCVETAALGAAVDAADPTEPGKLVGVTAEATGADSHGLIVDLGTVTTSTATFGVSNSIIHGAGADVLESEVMPTTNANEQLTLTHSDFSTVTTDGTPNEIVKTDPTDIKAAPAFVDAAADNFAERPGSPTINKGAADAFGETDVAGNPRTMGAAPDMGAYELAQKPVSGKPSVVAKTATTATVKVKVNPQGLPTKVHLVASAHGHATRTSAAFLPGEGTTMTSGKLTVSGLAKHTKYAIVADAANAAGKSVSAKASVKTAAHRQRSRAAAVITRYASPDGQTSSTCPHSEPCGINTAVSGAPAGSAVIVEPGTYGPLTASIVDTNQHVTIHGEAGAAEPVIDSVSNEDGITVARGSRLSDVVVSYSGDFSGVTLLGGSADHIAVSTSGNDTIACNVGGALTDSVCLATDDFGSAVGEPENVNSVGSLRGVTAEAIGSGGNGIELMALNNSSDVLMVTNSIIHGAGHDIDEVGQGTSESITVTHSDYATTTSNGAAKLSITPDNTDIKVPPRFVNPAADNFAELAGSPTINKGATDPSDTDLAGFPRTLGSAPDMGAYEFLQKAVVGTPKLGAVTAKTAKLRMKIDPEGLPTTITVTATPIYGGHVASSTTSAGHGTTSRSVKLTVAGLKKNTQYTYVVVTRSVTTRVVSATKLLTTPKR
jgi:hypothetical protein